MKEIIKNKKKVIIPSILVLVLIIGGAVYGVNHNKPIEKKPVKKAVHKVKEDKSAEASSEPAANESTTSKSATNKSDKPVENSKPSKAEKKAEKIHLRKAEVWLLLVEAHQTLRQASLKSLSMELELYRKLFRYMIQ